jgi:hypothetical protein
MELGLRQRLIVAGEGSGLLTHIAATSYSAYSQNRQGARTCPAGIVGAANWAVEQEPHSFSQDTGSQAQRHHLGSE